MGKQENLLTPEQRNLTSEEASIMGRKGGIQKGINWKKKRSFAELGEALANCKPTQKLIDKAILLFPDVPQEEINNKLIIAGRLLEKALKGDLNAIAMLRDTIGEKPIVKNEHTGRDGSPIDTNILITQDKLRKRADEMRSLNE
jgi:hypothetical protein